MSADPAVFSPLDKMTWGNSECNPMFKRLIEEKKIDKKIKTVAILKLRGKGVRGQMSKGA